LKHILDILAKTEQNLSFQKRTKMGNLKQNILLLALLLSHFLSIAQQKQPNILVIWGDDIGWQNVSAYGMGTMGYTTPNIDRIGQEGIRFTDHYAQNSCTAGPEFGER
jgi:arylsulfatase